MLDFLNQMIPNVMEKLPALWIAVVETLQMVGISGSISFVFGLIFGVILIVTRKGGIMQNRIVFLILDNIVNLFRAIPFIILISLLMDVTRFVSGTTIGVKGALFPLVIGTIPFFARQIESALSEIDHGLIEASQSMGDSPFQIIFRVYLKESIPSIIRGTTITFISLIGLTAMAGAVGAGGLGNFAIQYGYGRHQVDVNYVVVFIILLLITLIQSLGDFIIKKTTH